MINPFKKIMIIEDDSIDRYILRRSLIKAKIAQEIVEAATGIEALNILTGYSINKKELPDLIFLDMNMSVLGGFEFLEVLNQLSREYKTRCLVVITTALKNASDEKQALLYDNVIGYFEKPLQEQIFLKLREQLNLTRAF